MDVTEMLALIEKAKIKQATQAGALLEINAQLERDFGTSDPIKLAEILAEMEQKIKDLTETATDLETQLKEGFDWQALKKELGLC